MVKADSLGARIVPETAVPSRKAGGRIGKADSDPESPGHRVGLGRDLAHTAAGHRGRVACQRDDDTRVAAKPIERGRPAPRKRRRGPSRLASCTIIRPGETTSPGSAPIAVTTPGASALRVVKPTTSSAVRTCACAASTCARAAMRACLAASKSARVVMFAIEQVALPLILVIGLSEKALRRRECRSRRAQLIEFVLRVETRDHVSIAHGRSDADKPFGQPAADAEGECGLILRFDMAGEGDIRGRARQFDRDSAHGTDGWGSFVLALTCGAQERENGEDTGRRHRGGAKAGIIPMLRSLRAATQRRGARTVLPPPIISPCRKSCKGIDVHPPATARHVGLRLVSTPRTRRANLPDGVWQDGNNSPG